MRKFIILLKGCGLLLFSLLLLKCEGGGIDTTPPVVSITSPQNNQEVSGTITITAIAFDNSGRITKVEFFADGQKVGEDTTAPFSTNWVVSPATFISCYFIRKGMGPFGKRGYIC